MDERNMKHINMKHINMKHINMKETWYNIRRIRRLQEVVKAPKRTGNLSNRMYQYTIYSFVFPYKIYQEGIEQMSDKGRKRIIWEDDGCAYEPPVII